MKNILGPQGPEFDDQDCSNDKLPAKLKSVWDVLFQLDVFSSIGTNGIHSRVLKDLAD